MAASLMDVTISSLFLAAVLFIIGSCAQNVTSEEPDETTTNETTTTPPMTIESTVLTSPVTVTMSNATTTRQTTTVPPTGSKMTPIPITPLPPDVPLPPAAMLTISAITCGVIIGVFVVCYISTMMSLCICKCLMHECPTGRYKDPEEQPSATREG